MNYYRYEGHTLCAWEALPYERIGALPGEGEIIFLFAREMLTGRESFPVTDAALLTEKEGVETLDASAPGPAIPAELEEAIAEALGEQQKGLGYVVDCNIQEKELVRPMVNGGTHITEFLVN